MVYVLLTEGFEEIEAITPVDLLRRAGVEVQTVGVTGKTVGGSHGIPVVADIEMDEADWDGAEMVVLPGGLKGTNNLNEDARVHRAIEGMLQKEKYVTAICAAPSVILGGMGVLQGKKATCYPGMEDGMKGATPLSRNCVVDGHIITGRGVGGALDFACALVSALCGEEQARRVAAAVVHHAGA